MYITVFTKTIPDLREPVRKFLNAAICGYKLLSRVFDCCSEGLGESRSQEGKMSPVLPLLRWTSDNPRSSLTSFAAFPLLDPMNLGPLGSLPPSAHVTWPRGRQIYTWGQ